MDAEVYERAAAGHLLAGEPSAHAGDAVAAHPGRLGVVDPAQVPLLDVPLERLHVPPLPLREGYVDGPVCLPGRPHDPLGLDPRPGQRLLAEHVPAAPERRDGDRRVQVVRRPDAHHVQILPGDEVLPTPVEVGHPVEPAEFPQPLLLEPRQRDGLYPGHLHEVLQVLLARVAEPDDPYAQRLRIRVLQTILLVSGSRL